jgi:hypothetical protein
VPAQSETGDLFAVDQSEDATVASRISALELVQFVSRPTAAIESDRQTLKLTSPSWIQGPASVSESSADIGLSQLDDLFADVVGTLDALN